MNLVPLLSTIILISTLATLVLAIVSYVAFRLRDKRQPGATAKKQGPTVDKTFFVRFQPPAR